MPSYRLTSPRAFHLIYKQNAGHHFILLYYFRLSYSHTSHLNGDEHDEEIWEECIKEANKSNMESNSRQNTFSGAGQVVLLLEADCGRSLLSSQRADQLGAHAAGADAAKLFDLRLHQMDAVTSGHAAVIDLAWSAQVDLAHQHRWWTYHRRWFLAVEGMSATKLLTLSLMIFKK